MAWCSGAAQAPDGAHNAFAGLYNNATDGSLLSVFGLDAWVDTTGEHAIGFVEVGERGFIFGSATLWMSARAVRLDQTGPWGEGYGSVTPGGNPEAQVFFPTGSASGRHTFPSWPMFILPPGYSIWIQAAHGGGLVTATFWYRVT